MIGVEELERGFFKLLSCVEAQGYTRGYFTMIHNEIKRIISLSESMGWTSSLDVYKDYTRAQKTEHVHRKLIPHPHH